MKCPVLVQYDECKNDEDAKFYLITSSGKMMSLRYNVLELSYTVWRGVREVIPAIGFHDVPGSVMKIIHNFNRNLERPNLERMRENYMRKIKIRNEEDAEDINIREEAFLDERVLNVTIRLEVYP